MKPKEPVKLCCDSFIKHLFGKLHGNKVVHEYCSRNLEDSRYYSRGIIVEVISGA